MRLPDFDTKSKRVVPIYSARGKYNSKIKYMEVGDTITFRVKPEEYRTVQCGILVAGKRLEKRLGMKFKTGYDSIQGFVVVKRIA